MNDISVISQNKPEKYKPFIFNSDKYILLNINHKIFTNKSDKKDKFKRILLSILLG